GDSRLDRRSTACCLVVPLPAGGCRSPGFPPSASDLKVITNYAAQIGEVFRARLIAADFVRDVRGEWWFLEAGPGAAAGTAHEAVFKYVAERLRRNMVP